MDLMNSSFFTDMAQMFLASLKSLDVLHPLVVHFPVALLMVAPVFIVLGMMFSKARKMFFLSALILMVLGTVSLYVAYLSGQSASELVDRTPEISSTLNRHKELAHAARTVFTVLTVVFTVIVIVLNLMKKEPNKTAVFMISALFLLAYSFCLLFIMNTAHQGGLLVHKHGVHAMLPSSK